MTKRTEFVNGFVLSTMLTLPMSALATPAGSTDHAARALAGPAGGQGVVYRELDLYRTGKVAVPDLRSQGEVREVRELRELIVRADAMPDPPELRVDKVSAASPAKPFTWLRIADDPTLALQYGEAFAATVGACRFKVASDLGVRAANVEAGTVTFRWTVDPSGRARDVSTIVDSPTDGAVTECATRVVVSQKLLNPVQRPLALEWTYSFRRLPIKGVSATQEASR